MECIKGCGKGECTKDIGCPRVEAMAKFIVVAHERPPYTTKLPEVVSVGKITAEQWRDGYSKKTTPCFKRAVEEVLCAEIVYETSGIMGENAVGVRRLTFLPQNYE